MKWITSFCLLLGQSRGISGIYWSPCVRLNGSMVSVFALWQWKRGSPKLIDQGKSTPRPGNQPNNMGNWKIKTKGNGTRER